MSHSRGAGSFAAGTTGRMGERPHIPRSGTARLQGSPANVGITRTPTSARMARRSSSSSSSTTLSYHSSHFPCHCLSTRSRG
eukprot:5406372-Pyramimonas_sp.AAC.1